MNILKIMKRGGKASTTRDMTSGNIILHLVQFAVPLILGNLFQMMYNTVDSLVVGQFVGKEALAAIGSTTTIVNVLIFFFNGFSIGAGVVISRFFGAEDREQLHKAVETTMFMTFVACVAFSLIGLSMTRFMLDLMVTPEDVFGQAETYLRIYFAGFSGLLIYNMCSGILRAVGDTRRPLMFLVLTSVVNIFLDLLFVLGLGAGIEGVAFATILAQFISAFLVLILLVRSKDVYYLSFKDLHCDMAIMRDIVRIGLPTAIQSVVTSVSNVFVQSYINVFGSTVMAGWGCYNKLDMFIMLPMQSIAQASTTFVGQNVGAKKYDRVNKGTVQAILLVEGVTFAIACLLFAFAVPVTGIFTSDSGVVQSGVLFLRTNIYFLLFNAVNHTLAGGLRGRGDSTGPMIIMLFSFVAVRQVYLFIMTHFIANIPATVGFGYPVGWMTCCVIELIYYYVRWYRNDSSCRSVDK